MRAVARSASGPRSRMCEHIRLHLDLTGETTSSGECPTRPECRASSRAERTTPLDRCGQAASGFLVTDGRQGAGVLNFMSTRHSRARGRASRRRVHRAVPAGWSPFAAPSYCAPMERTHLTQTKRCRVSARGCNVRHPTVLPRRCTPLLRSWTRRRFPSRTSAPSSSRPPFTPAGWDAMRQSPRGGPAHEGPGDRPRQAGQPRRGEARRLRPLPQPNIPLAVVEAKDNNHARRRRHAAGARLRGDARRAVRVQLATATASCCTTAPALATPSSSELALDAVPVARRAVAPLLRVEGTRHQSASASSPSTTTTTAAARRPRYYQLIAINRTVEAVARGQDRILLVMATGTGKTYTAFQIIWRLWKAGVKKRILFLADRNILVDQTKTNDFKPFGAAMTKITNRTGRQELRDLPRAVPGRVRHRGRAEHLQAVLARLLRPDRRRRVPPRQRRRGLGVARDPRLLLVGHAARPDRHAEGDRRRLEHRTTSASRSTRTR